MEKIPECTHYNKKHTWQREQNIYDDCRCVSLKCYNCEWVYYAKTCGNCSGGICNRCTKILKIKE